MLNLYALSIFCLLSATSAANFQNEISFLPNTFLKDTKQEFLKVINPKSSSRYEKSALQDITEEVLGGIFKTFEGSLEKRQELEAKLAKKGKVLPRKKGDISLNRDFRADPVIKDMEYSNLLFESITDHLYKTYNLSLDTLTNDLPGLEGKLISESRQACTQRFATATCDPYSKYRRIDGQCNNLRNPRWGSAMACQPRLLRPNYVGTSGFRVSVNGDPLPRPRDLSLNVHFNINRPTTQVTHMYMFFGQLLDHDLTQTPQSTTVDNQVINCCPPEEETHPQCAPILIRQNDPFYSQFGVTCINFVRSAICPTCSLGPRQVMNQITSTIDASFVYGNSENLTLTLRTNDGTGRLRTQASFYGDLMPRSSNPENDQCSFPETNDICFEAGDNRANQHTVLASLHTIFMREHNRIVSNLRILNPNWGEEMLFQEARRIVGAQVQAITYKEYLPITLGQDRMSYFRLWSGSWSRYDPNEDPTTLLEFTTAAFRFGHSMINSVMANRPLNATNGQRLLRDEFFQPFELYRGLIGPIVQGASNSPAQFFDRHLVPDVTDFLFRLRGEQTGLDLAAININRGRDHGLPTYVDTVRHCSDGQVIIRNFYDLVRYNLMQSEQANVLEWNYRFVQDIDLWTGILSEIYKEGAVVGPTAACIIGLQFHKLKYGDRFYFEHWNEAGSFTSQQVQELRRTTLSQIICLNTEIQSLPRNAMIFASRNNPNINCRNVRGIDLSYWRE